MGVRKCLGDLQEFVRAPGKTSTKVRRTQRVKVHVVLGEIGAALELWIAEQPYPKPTRREAARKLIHQALGTNSEEPRLATETAREK